MRPPEYLARSHQRQLLSAAFIDTCATSAGFLCSHPVHYAGSAGVRPLNPHLLTGIAIYPPDVHESALTGRRFATATWLIDVRRRAGGDDPA